MMDGVSVVIPTVGRNSLRRVLTRLAIGDPPPVPVQVLVVDDRPGRPPPLALPPVPGLPVRVLPGRAAGPAAARNTGWRAARYRWVAFLDDDVLPQPGWLTALAADLAVPAAVGGVQGRVVVPLPGHRRATDWERNTASLATACWITADMAYRRQALADVGGFDERFPRAYREDSELAARVAAAGWRLVRGQRGVTHPVRTEGPWVSLRTQRGNADDALLRRLYGRQWRLRLRVARGRRGRHAAVVAAAAAAVVAALTGYPRLAGLAAAGWAAGTAELTVARVADGPKTPREVATMVATSVLMPPVAVGYWWRGWWRHRHARPIADGRRLHYLA